MPFYSIPGYDGHYWCRLKRNISHVWKTWGWIWERSAFDGIRAICGNKPHKARANRQCVVSIQPTCRLLCKVPDNVKVTDSVSWRRAQKKNSENQRASMPGIHYTLSITGKLVYFIEILYWSWYIFNNVTLFIIAFFSILSELLFHHSFSISYHGYFLLRVDVEITVLHRQHSVLLSKIIYTYILGYIVLIYKYGNRQNAKIMEK